MTRKLIAAILIVSIAILAGTAALVNNTTATAPSSGFSGTVIASGDLPEPVRTIMLYPVKFDVGADFDSGLEVPKVGVSEVEVSKIVMANYTFEPGASSGWHHHGGPVWVVIKSGNLTAYDESCKPQVYRAPIAYFDSGGFIHNTVNEGSERVEMQITYMLPKDGEPRIDVPNPGTCSLKRE